VCDKGFKWFATRLGVPVQVAELKQTLPLHEQLLDSFLAAAHQSLTSMEGLRVIAGGCMAAAPLCMPFADEHVVDRC
jgi:hypothetical protein